MHIYSANVKWTATEPRHSARTEDNGETATVSSRSLQPRGGNKNKAAVISSEDIVTEEGEHRL